MKHLGRTVGLLAVLAVPTTAVLYLYSRPDPGGSTGDSETPYVPPPLYSGPPQDGLTFALRSDPEKIDVRSFAHLAIYVPAGESAATFLPKGPFTATFRGKLRVPTREHYTFTFVGHGAFELVIDDQIVVAVDGSTENATGKRVRLKKGEHPFTARYTSPLDGPAILRVYWECDEFGREPIPPEFLSHGASESLQQFASLRRGRRLVEELRCGRCHFGETMGPVGPSLVDAGRRLRRGFMAKWIEAPDPKRMPRMLHGSSAPQDAADIAAYLATLGTPDPPPEFIDDDRELGALVFSDYGCIACHTLPDAATVGDRLSLGETAIRFHEAALIEFLRFPDRYHPMASMPNFSLDQDRAKAVAAFLLSRPGAKTPAVAAGDPIRGRRLVAEKGCVACHGLAVGNEMRARDRAVTRGGRVACKVAKYELSEEDVAGLRAFLTRRPAVLPNPIETVEYEMHRSGCVNCHGWRGRAPLLDTVQAEATAVAPEDPDGIPHRLPPDLTLTGSKLRTEWLTGWLAGTITERPRPWLHTRMPKFRLDPEVFARGFAFAEGYGLTTVGSRGWQDGTEPTVATAGADFDPAPAAAAELREIGAQLMARDGGLGCIQCHGVGDRAAEEVFEAPGINLAATPVRLRKEYYHRWVRDPLRIDPISKMTRFTDDQGLTGLTEVLGGRGQAQFEAIWRYLESLGR